jgi:hypothetical protein
MDETFSQRLIRMIKELLAPGEKGHFGSGEKGQLSVG